MIFNNAINIVLFYFSFSLSVFTFADGVERSLKDGFRVVLDDADWHHISEGNDSKDWIGGAHDFAKFWTKRENKKESVFFDLKNQVYIVSSKKGDSLIDIVSDLRGEHRPRYHTLFPPHVLTKEFVLDAFEKAYDEGNINLEDGSFWTQTVGDQRAVAGAFVRPYKTFHLKTFYPDINLIYRRQFADAAQTKFPFAQFLQWDLHNQLWLHVGNWHESEWSSIVDELRKKGHIPDPVWTSYRRYDNAGFLASSEEFVFAFRLRDHIIQANQYKTFNVFELFFADKNKPTGEELFFIEVMLICCGYDAITKSFETIEGPGAHELGLKLLMCIMHPRFFGLSKPAPGLSEADVQILRRGIASVKERFARLIIQDEAMLREFLRNEMTFEFKAFRDIVAECTIDDFRSNAKTMSGHDLFENYGKFLVENRRAKKELCDQAFQQAQRIARGKAVLLLQEYKEKVDQQKEQIDKDTDGIENYLATFASDKSYLMEIAKKSPTDHEAMDTFSLVFLLRTDARDNAKIMCAPLTVKQRELLNIAKSSPTNSMPALLPATSVAPQGRHRVDEPEKRVN